MAKKQQDDGQQGDGALAAALVAPKQDDGALELDDDAEITGSGDYVRVRFRNPKEEIHARTITTPTGRRYEKRQDGSYVVHREDLHDLRNAGLEVVA